MDKKRNQNRKDQQTLKNTDSVEIRTFGHFTVLINRVPVHFRRSKSKEILAFLIDKRGQTVSKQVLANEVLNEDRYDDRVKNRLHTDLVSLREDLENCGSTTMNMALSPRDSIVIIMICLKATEKMSKTILQTIWPIMNGQKAESLFWKTNTMEKE